METAGAAPDTDVFRSSVLHTSSISPAYLFDANEIRVRAGLPVIVYPTRMTEDETDTTATDSSSTGQGDTMRFPHALLGEVLRLDAELKQVMIMITAACLLTHVMVRTLLPPPVAQTLAAY